jgi:MFS family permease
MVLGAGQAGQTDPEHETGHTKGGPPTSVIVPPWRQGRFLKVWSGQAVSGIGTAMTELALPTAAIKLLGAGPFEVGLLAVLQYIPYPLVGLLAGVWVDRAQRRWVMIVCDSVRLAALISVPLAFFMGALTLAHLYAVALVMGLAAVFFNTAIQGYLPTIVDRSQLIRANAMMEGAIGGAQVIGPAFAGLLVQASSSAIALLADGVTYVVSVATLLWAGREDLLRAPASTGFVTEAWLGLRTLIGHVYLRLIVLSAGIANLGNQIVQATVYVYAYKEIHLMPGQVGLIFAVGGLGATLGALIATRAIDRLRVGPALAIGAASLGLAILIPIAGGSPYPTLALSAVSLLIQIGVSIYNVGTVSYRQAAVGLELQGRVTATARVFVWGAIPVGALIGGIVGAHLGVVFAIYLGGCVGLCSVIPLLIGPVRLRHLPSTAAALN